LHAFTHTIFPFYIIISAGCQNQYKFNFLQI